MPNRPTAMNSIIILDRDGVINYDSEQFIKSPEEWRPIPGSLEAIARLCQSGYRVVVATNQSGIGRGLFEMSTLNAIHDKMQKALSFYGGRIDSIYYCPHTNKDACECRKPSPGMIREIAIRYNVDLSEVYLVGDAPRDLQAAHVAGARPVLVRTGKGAATEAAGDLPPETLVFNDLAEAAKHILSRRK